MTRNRILILIATVSFLVGVIVGDLGIIPKNWHQNVKEGIRRENLLATVNLDKESENLSVGGEKDLSVKVTEQPEFDFNIDMRGATIRIEAETVEVEGGEWPARGEGVSLTSAPMALGSEGEIVCKANEYSVPLRSGIFISEVAWMGTSVSPADEWVELKNTRSNRVDISGWTLVNEDGGLKIVFPEGIVIGSRELFLLERTDDNSVLGVQADLIYRGALSNEDEELLLFDNHCQLIDMVAAAPDWPAGESVTRKTMERDWTTLTWRTAEIAGGTPAINGGMQLIAMSASTPIETIKSLPLDLLVDEGRVELREIQTGSEADSKDEFVELYNSGTGAVDLTGWMIKRKSSGGTEYSLITSSRLEGVSIASGKCLLTYNEGGYDGEVVGDVGWSQSNTLSYTNNSVVLYNAEGEVVDEVTWTDIPKNESYEKVGEIWQVQVTPNPENSSS